MLNLSACKLFSSVYTYFTMEMSFKYIILLILPNVWIVHWMLAGTLYQGTPKSVLGWMAPPNRWSGIWQAAAGYSRPSMRQGSSHDLLHWWLAVGSPPETWYFLIQPVTCLISHWPVPLLAVANRDQLKKYTCTQFLEVKGCSENQRRCWL